MRISRPFVRLPFDFDHEKLIEEISQFDEDDWRPHPMGFAGNSSMVLVSSKGEENDDFTGPMLPSPRLQRTPYIRQVMARFDTVVGRSRLMRLAPGASVTTHTDSHYFWRNHLRIHVPIVTNPDVTFYCDSERVHMAAGEAWTFDNWREHSVENRSDQARIHLVIDTVGSARLWRIIEGPEEEPKAVAYDDAADPSLRFENFRGLPVMPPVELRSDLHELVEDVDDAGGRHAAEKARLRALTADFVRDWHSQWMIHGPELSGFRGFKSLQDGYRSVIEQLPDAMRLLSNGESFKEAAGYTLDAALAPSNFTAAGSDDAVAAPAGRPRFDRPVFIIAAPRSGSTLLFETLALNRELWTVGDESHKHFESIASLRPSEANPSNRLTAEMATPDVTDTLINSLAADLVDTDGRPFSQLPPLGRPNEIRFLEKTPKNSLRIPFIAEAFPDARFIFLYRDAKQNISSLLDSWRSRGYVTYQRLPGWPADNPWSHLLIPDWQELAGRPLAEIVTRQWLVTNRTIVDDLRQLPPERWCTVDYDALLHDTKNVLQRLCLFAEIIFGPRMQEAAARPLKLSKYTLTAPHPEKWKRNAAEMEPYIGAAEDLMATLRALS